MTDALRLRSMLALGVSAATLGFATHGFAADAAPSANETSVVQTLVVTAQRREEAIQDVPIAVSAFSADTLKTQQIAGGEDLLKAIPNVNFAHSNFGGYNFQIRGIGTKGTGSTSADAGIGDLLGKKKKLKSLVQFQKHHQLAMISAMASFMSVCRTLCLKI